mmetsp:Transcript_18880/g.21667  ORF Transcript_18880/g.21667 Transcript_18880/m.21667 type:complete len:109 (+) Transcript_18880:312-638(+)
MYEQKDRGKKSIENEYLNMHHRSLQQHKNKLEEIRVRGENILKNFWQAKYQSNKLGPDKYRGKTMQEIKDEMVTKLESRKEEIQLYNNEILQLNEILTKQTNIIASIE